MEGFNIKKTRSEKVDKIVGEGEKIRTTIFLPIELRDKLKIKAAQDRTTMTKLIIDLLEGIL